MRSSLFLVTALCSSVALVSCGDSGDTADTTQSAQPTSPEMTTATPVAREITYHIDPAASQVKWTGTMLGIRSHFGTVNYTEGNLSVADGQLTGGNFKVDLTSIAPLDENYAADTEKENTRSMLVDHLKSEDFFDVANHPDAKLQIVEVNGNTAKAELTLRGKRGTETIEDIQLTENNGELKATGRMTFDRQKYDVKWSSGVQEAVLSDSIEIIVDLTARAPAI